MQKLKIFLASSSELKTDREAIREFLSVENDRLSEQDIYLELVQWEHFFDAVSETRLQDDYNKVLADCDVVLSLFFSKAGKYTQEEFDVAWHHFKDTGKPKIYTYFKDGDVNMNAIDREQINYFFDFKDRLSKICHFPTKYTTIDNLLVQLKRQLEDLLPKLVPKSQYSIPHHLTPPPFKSEVFLGREDDLKAIHDQLFNDDNLLLLINGNGGVGKTTLASRYYEKYQSDYQHMAWVFCETSIVNALLTALERPLALAFDSTMPTEERFRLLLTAMAALNKPCLLALDNTNEIDDLNESYQNLRRCSNFHLLLTTRITDFANAASYKIDGLPEDKALDLFRQYYKQHQDNEDDIVKQIHAAVGGNTLVIELLAKNLNQVNQFENTYSVADLLADLRSKGLLSLSTSEAVTTAYQAQGKLRAEKAETIITAMYDLMALSEAEAALLSVFAVLPAENIAFTTLKDLLNTTENLKSTLKALAQKGWIDYNQNDNSFKCSPVIQEITRNKNANLRANCKGIISILIDKLDYETRHIIDNYQQSSLYARYAQSVVAAFVQLDDDHLRLCERIGNYFTDTGNLADALVFYNTMNAGTFVLSQAEPDDTEFKNCLATSYSNLGDTHAALGNLDQALQFYQDYNSLKKELYNNFPTNVSFKNGLAISYEKLGTTHAAIGKLDQALLFHQERSRLSKELHASIPTNVEFKNGLAVSFGKLGEIYTTLGKFDQALQFYQDYNALAIELHDSFPNNVSFKNGLAISHQCLGETYATLGKLDQALQCYQDYNALKKELYDSFPNNVSFKNGLAISYSKLGSTHSALGNLDQVLRFYQDYNALEKELHDSFPNNVSFKNSLAISYSKLGDIYEQSGDTARVVQHYQLALGLWAELVANFPSYVEFKNNLSWVETKLAKL